MSNAAPFLVFLVATVALNLSPGPDMLYVISRTLEGGRRAGIISAFGIGVGTLVHMSVAAVGLSALLISFPLAYQTIRIIGAAYLVFLGVRIIRSNPQTRERLNGREKCQTSLMAIFHQGVITNVLNPKVALFFLAFLPQFVDYSAGVFALQILFLGLVFDCSGTTWNVIVAILAGKANSLIQGRPEILRIQRTLPGLILIGLGLLILV
ncbi:MAG TPA: LysE family translocator [Candidatus Bathyarchaeia archaeon]|nr:LysE family translocator [Candidatus Bathyarchaeia archaeon]